MMETEPRLTTIVKKKADGEKIRTGELGSDRLGGRERIERKTKI